MVGKRFAWLAAAALTCGFAACGGETGGAEDCEPGTDVFCKCQANLGEGTKRCKDDGASYEECITPEGACSDLEPTSGPGAGGGGTQTDCTPGKSFPCTCESGDPGTQICNEDGDALGPCETDDGEKCGSGATSSSTGGSGGLALYAACSDDDECDSGSCPMGFCSQECGGIDDCGGSSVDGTCARFQGGSVQICAPFCDLTAGCVAIFGEPSTCGYGVDPSDPGYYFTVCGDWDDELSPLPPGLECTDDESCNLGNAGLESVCDIDECVEGCYGTVDCPDGFFCDSDGDFPGSCF